MVVASQSQQSQSKLADTVFAVVRQIPRGKVTTYGQLAKAAGTHPRVIGRILHHNTDPKTYPCHRVVKSDGSLASGYAFGGPVGQQRLLEAEGIVFSGKKIQLDTFGWE